MERKVNQAGRGHRRRQRGFSLIELLIVISIIIVLLLFISPYARGPNIQKNEASAMNTLKAMYTAETMYNSFYPSKGFTCNLADLGPPPAGQGASPSGANLLASDAVSGSRDGYTFTAQGCVTVPNGQRVVNFQIVAVPEVPGTSGNRAFCIDVDGQIRNDPSGNAQACVSQR